MVRSRGDSYLCVSATAAIAFCAVTRVFAQWPSGQAPGMPPRILAIQSYHPGYAWGDRILHGLQAALESRPVDLSVEYLDSQRNAGPEYEAALEALLEVKYGHDPAPAVVVACDDPALDFVLLHREKLLKGAPVVFCGVNRYDEAKLAGRPDVTGVVESADFRGTIQLALRLGPDVRRVFAIGSGTSPTRLANLARLRELKDEFGDQLDLDTLANVTSRDVSGLLADLPSHSALLIYYHLADELGHSLPFAESMRLVNAHARGPVYTCWDFAVEEGAFGGRVVSGFEQGRAAGALALRVLGGEPADRIPVMRESPNVYMFNYYAEQ